MNSKNSKTSDHHGLLLNLTDKIDVKRDAYIDLSNLSIYCAWRNTKKTYKETSLKYQLQHRMKNLYYLMDHIVYQMPGLF